MKHEPETPSRLPIDEETLAQHAAFVRGVARAVTQGDTDADDVAQEAWLSALKSHAVHADAPRGWLATIVRRRGVDRARRASRRRAGESGARARPDLPEPDEIAGIEEMRALVVRRVLALEEPYRTAVLLRHYHGVSVAETAEILGVPLETCRTRLRRGLARLRLQFERDGTQGDPRRRSALLALAGVLPATSVFPITLLAAAAIMLLTLGGYLTWQAAQAEEWGADAGHAALATVSGDAERAPFESSPPTLSTRGAGDPRPESEALPSPRTAPGVWLHLEVAVPESVEKRPGLLTVKQGGALGKRVSAPFLADSDEGTWIEIGTLLEGTGRGPVLRLTAEVNHDHCMPLRLKIKVPRAARTVQHSGVGRAVLPLAAELTAAPCIVSGSVSVPVGYAARSARLALFSEHPDRAAPAKRVDQCTLGEDGSFRLRAPAPGRYILAACIDTSSGLAVRPETLRIDVPAGETTVPLIEFSDGLALTGLVETPIGVDEARLGVRVSLQHRSNASYDWGDTTWVGSRFEWAELEVELQEGNRLRVEGLGPYSYALEMQQGVWVAGQRIPTIYAAKGGGRSLKKTVTVTAPAADVRLPHPFSTWLLRIKHESSPRPLQWIGVPCYEIGRFFSFEPDAEGRLAVFVPLSTPERPAHPFIGPTYVRIESRIDPHAWNQLTFPDIEGGASLEVELLPPFAGQTDHFEITFHRKREGATDEWMPGRFYAARKGRTLQFRDLVPGTWSYSLQPATADVVDYAAHFPPMEGEVEIKPGTRNRIEVALSLGGYIGIRDVQKLAMQLGFPAVKQGLVQFHKLAYEIKDANGTAVETRFSWRKPEDGDYVSARGHGPIYYAGIAGSNPITFWPALPPGEYVIEFWTPDKRDETRKELRVDVVVGETANVELGR